MALCFALSASPQQPDNTRENKNNRPTADQAKETKADRELAAKIRKSVVDDKALSTNAQEREAIQAKAQQLTNSSAVHNELTVVSK
jgi:hypothetical protein